MARKRRYGTGSLYQRADGMWIGSIEAGWTSRGTRRRVTVSAKTEREARIKLKDKEREIALNGIAAEGGSVRTTVKEWAEEWIAIQKDRVSPGTLAANRSAVKKWIIPELGHVRLNQLSPPHIRQLAKAGQDAGVSTATVTRTDRVIRKMLKDAITEGGHHVPESVFKVAGPSGVLGRREDIPVDQALVLLGAAKKRTDSARWVAAFLQALRPAEARGLTWDRVDFERKLIDVSWQLATLPYNVKGDRASGFSTPRDHEAIPLVDSYHLVRPKTRAGKRQIPLLPWMENELRRWREIQADNPHGLVWCRPNGRPLSQKDDARAWNELLQDSGVGEDFDLYQARHTTATLLRRSNVDDETIELIMGHASILSTKAYLHSDLGRARDALEKVATILQLPS